MSYNSFIPTVWNASLLMALRNVHHFKVLTNDDYEKDAKNARSVVINQIDDVTISDYDRANGVSFSEAQTSSQTLDLDQEKSFGKYVNSIDKAQCANGGEIMQKIMQSAAYGFQDLVDTQLAAEYANAGIVGGADEAAIGVAGTPIEITVDGGGSSIKVIDWLGRLERRYHDAKCPMDAPRYLVIPPWLKQKMVQAQLLDVRGFDNKGTFENGKVTEVFGFGIRVSNNVSNSGGEFRVMAGNRNCITFAEQIMETQAGRRSGHFEDYIAGLYVYGYETIRPDQLMCSIIEEGAEGQ